MMSVVAIWFVMNVPEHTSNVSNGNTIMSAFSPGYLPYCIVAMYLLISVVGILCDVVIT